MKKYKRLNYIALVLLIISVIIAIISNAKGWKLYYSLPPIISSGLLSGYLIASLIYYRSVKNSDFQKKRLQLWNSISYRVKNAGETTFNEMPVGIILFNDDFIIEWANNYAKKIFQSELVQRKFENLNADFAELISERNPKFEITIYDRNYSCEHVLRDHTIYMTDITDKTQTIKRYMERILTLGILNLDNLDLSTSMIDAQEKSLQMSNIIGILTEWAKDCNLCIKGYSDERYLLIMDSKTLDRVIKDGFSILGRIKNYCEKAGFRITASIGIVSDDKNAVQLMEEAEDLLNLALSRGGNQAVVKRDGETKYFGARSEAFESRTPPFIRVKTEELIALFKTHKNIYIQSHKDMDADAFGACLVASKIARACDCVPYIVFSEKSIDATVRQIYLNMKETYSRVLNDFVEIDSAIKKIKEDDLVLFVDCQYQNLLMNDKLYKKAKNIAIIDHHRRSEKAMSKYDYIYSQPSSSSSVELLVEMLDFIEEEKIDISPEEATWMITGVLVDTNNFMFHTTYRTFDVLSKLQTYGAEMGKAQRFLREDFDKYKKKMEILNNLERINDSYGIVTCEEDQIYDRSFIAQLADKIITIDKLKASFCIGRDAENEINISARSLDEENVQVIMEKLGGGGHFTTAAAQFTDTTIAEVKEKLINVLQENQVEGEETMKVILNIDIKGKGKVDDTVDLPMGRANYLIRNGQAVEATDKNIQERKSRKIKEAMEHEKLLKEKQQLKEQIDTMTVKVPVKVGANGKLFGSVSTKEVCEKFKEQNGIELDKRKINYTDIINALGTYKLPYEVYNDIIATITLYVVEGSSK